MIRVGVFKGNEKILQELWIILVLCERVRVLSLEGIEGILEISYGRLCSKISHTLCRRRSTCPFPSQVQLFDLAADPTESTNVASEHPDLVAEMLERLEAIEGTAIPPHVNPNILKGNPNLNGGFFGTGWCELSQ